MGSILYQIAGRAPPRSGRVTLPAGRRPGEPAAQRGGFRTGPAAPDRRGKPSEPGTTLATGGSAARRTGGPGCGSGPGRPCRIAGGCRRELDVVFAPSGPFRGLSRRGGPVGGPDRRGRAGLGESRGSDTVGAERSRRPPTSRGCFRSDRRRHPRVSPSTDWERGHPNARPMTCRVRIASVKTRCVQPPRTGARTALDTSSRTRTRTHCELWRPRSRRRGLTGSPLRGAEAPGPDALLRRTSRRTRRAPRPVAGPVSARETQTCSMRPT